MLTSYCQVNAAPAAAITERTDISAKMIFFIDIASVKQTLFSANKQAISATLKKMTANLIFCKWEPDIAC